MKNHKKHNLKDIILGGQDGLVNVLGIVLAVASATYATKDILIAGIAATFAESISMGAVAFTSSKAAKEYYLSKHIKKFPKEYKSPFNSALVVGFSAIIGSLIPILPFFFTNVSTGIVISVIISIITLFIVGAIKAIVTTGNWKKSGFELSAIGISAAIIGYLIGLALGATIH